MSAPDLQQGPGTREVAYRVLAAEYDDATLTVSDSDDDRAPNYVILPTGARVNRVFVIGVLTEVEDVSENVTRGRIVDPTGAFVVYAGQYQPDAKAFLEDVSVPTFVAVTGKARTYQPDDSTQVYSSIRPETITEVDATTRDRWTARAAEHTLDRIATIEPVLSREERGESLQDALVADGTDPHLAVGIPLAIDHYRVTPTYLDALRETALEALEVVAGTRDEVSRLTVDPDADAQPTTPGDPTPDPTGSADDDERDDDTPTEDQQPDEADQSGTESPEPSPVVGADQVPSEDPSLEADSAEAVDAGAVDTAELYEMDDTEREAIEEEYGTEFTTGTNVTDTPAAAPSIDEDPSEDPVKSASEPTESTPSSDQSPDADRSEEPVEDEDDHDLVSIVIDVMRDLDDGDGATRDDVRQSVQDQHDVEPSAVEDAIQTALMDGKCYEPTDGHLKAI